MYIYICTRYIYIYILDATRRAKARRFARVLAVQLSHQAPWLWGPFAKKCASDIFSQCSRAVLRKEKNIWEVKLGNRGRF